MKMRQTGGFTTEAQIEQLYDNMNPEHKLYIRLDDITDLEELSARAAEYELIEKQRRERTSERTPTTGPSVTAAVYNREECCWRCKQLGHTRLDCKRPPKKFCSCCGKDGVFTRDCHPGKRGTGRRRGYRPALTTIRVRYQPRLHVTVLHRQLLTALIDSGSEISFVSTTTARYAHRLGYAIRADARTVQLVDGQSTNIPGALALPVNIEKKMLQHDFLDMLSLKSPILIVVDLWAKIELTLRALPCNQSRPRDPACDAAQ